MILEKYTIRFRSLNESDLETVRMARNSDFIRNKMIFRDIISAEMQRQWYHSLDAARDVYMIVEYAGRPCGLINIKDVDYATGTSEAGLFIWDAEILTSHVPVLCAWLAAESGYGLLGGKRHFIRVLNQNKVALDFNTQLGYVALSEENGVVLMQQTKDSFSQATRTGRQHFLASAGTESRLYLSFGDHDQDGFRKEHLLSYFNVIGVKPDQQQGDSFWFNIDF